jgi:hypothetical protein
VSALTVKVATNLQLGPLQSVRLQYHQDFVDLFAPELRGDPDAMARLCGLVATAQRQLWKLKWDNEFKEVYWRLVLNGLATAERMHLQECRCVCGPVAGGQPAGRRHHFWECPVARSVVGVLQQQLVGWYAGVLQPRHLLCMECPVVALGPGAPAPDHALHKGVWRVVCLAAINAMDVGRRAANKLGAEVAEQAAAEAAQQQAAAVPQGQRLITDLLQPAALTPAQQQHQAQVRQRRQLLVQQEEQQRQQAAAARLAEVQQQAVSRFWELLQDFVALEAAPQSWLPLLAPDHPFLRVTGDALGVHCVAVAPDAG